MWRIDWRRLQTRRSTALVRFRWRHRRTDNSNDQPNMSNAVSQCCDGIFRYFKVYSSCGHRDLSIGIKAEVIARTLVRNPNGAVHHVLGHKTKP